MSKKENTTLRIEPELKERAAVLFRSLGMDLSTATRIFYIQALRCHGLPFEVKLDASQAAELRESIRELFDGDTDEDTSQDVDDGTSEKTEQEP